jgi:hypothetical protein
LYDLTFCMAQICWPVPVFINGIMVSRAIGW